MMFSALCVMEFLRWSIHPCGEINNKGSSLLVMSCCKRLHASWREVAVCLFSLNGLSVSLLMRFKYEFMYKKSPFQLLPCLSPLALSFRNKNVCRPRCSEWQEGHDSRHQPLILLKWTRGRLCRSQPLAATGAWL